MMTLEQIEAIIPFEVLKTLVDGGLFDTKNGSVEVHFDADGRIRKMERRYVSYRI